MHKYPLVRRAVSSGKCPVECPGSRGTGVRSGPRATSFEQSVERLLEARSELAVHHSRSIRIAELLLPVRACRNLEVHATVVVGFVGGGEIEVGEEDLVGAAGGEVKERIAHDSVVQH